MAAFYTFGQGGGVPNVGNGSLVQKTKDLLNALRTARTNGTIVAGALNQMTTDQQVVEALQVGPVDHASGTDQTASALTQAAALKSELLSDIAAFNGADAQIDQLLAQTGY